MTAAPHRTVGDTPLAVQAEDALAAVATLAAETAAPVGVFGFSQGAWAAALAASRSPEVKFLALVGCCGVSPAVQMRYYTDELLRRAGYGATDRAQLQQVDSVEHLRRLPAGAPIAASRPNLSSALRGISQWPRRRCHDRSAQA